MSIPNVCAVPVIAPKVKGFFIVGIIEVVKTIAIASPIPKISPSFIASEYEFVFVKLIKTVIANDVTKQAIRGTM